SSSINAVVGSHFGPSRAVSTKIAVPWLTVATDELIEKNIIVIILQRTSQLNRFIPQIQLPSSDLSIYSTYFIATASPNELPDIMWSFDPLTETPVSIDEIAGDGQFNVTKIYKKSGNVS
uniref:Vitellogenin n=1 Tax=Romanomermis culicivorax TaxID=13658 RepID=A0A915JE82_ROMCU